MANETQTVNADGTKPASAGKGKAKVVYEGQCARVVEDHIHGLIACPREKPKTGEGDYLLCMIDELRGVYDKVTRNGELGEIHIEAYVVRGVVWHVVVVGKGGDVRVLPLVNGYVRPIMAADKVEIEAADGDNAVYRGDFAVVVEDKGGSLRAYARRGLRVEPAELMYFVIREVRRKFKKLTRTRDVKAVTVQGLLWMKGIAYRPVVNGGPELGLMWAHGDYVDLVKTARWVFFNNPNC